MMTFKEWLISEGGFNNPGVPHYAASDTPAIRGPFDDVGGMGLPLRMLSGIQRTRSQIYDMYGVKSHRDLPGREFVAKDGTRGVITKTNDTHVSARLFVPMTATMQYGTLGQLEPTHSCLNACSPNPMQPKSAGKASIEAGNVVTKCSNKCSGS
jgi:hypothetical protein